MSYSLICVFWKQPNTHRNYWIVSMAKQMINPPWSKHSEKTSKYAPPLPGLFELNTCEIQLNNWIFHFPSSIHFIRLCGSIFMKIGKQSVYFIASRLRPVNAFEGITAWKKYAVCFLTMSTKMNFCELLIRLC